MDRRRVATAILVACLGVWLALVLQWLGQPLAHSEIADLAVSALAFEAFLAALAFAGAALTADPVGARLGLGRGRLSLAETAVLALGTLALSYALYGALERFDLKQQSALAELETQLTGLRGSGLALALVSLGVGAGVAEELLCRGLVQRTLVPRLGAPLGIALAAAFFGLLHVDPVHAGFATLLGAYLGAGAHLGASTRTAIACHVTNNLLAVLAPAYAAGMTAAAPPGIAAGLAVALLALLWVWRRARARSPSASGRPGSPAGSLAHP